MNETYAYNDWESRCHEAEEKYDNLCIELSRAYMTIEVLAQQLTRQRNINSALRRSNDV